MKKMLLSFKQFHEYLRSKSLRFQETFQSSDMLNDDMMYRERLTLTASVDVIF